MSGIVKSQEKGVNHKRKRKENSYRSEIENYHFLGATKHLYNWLCPWLVGLSVGQVTHASDDPHVAPYWPT